MASQVNMNPDTLIKVLEWLASAAVGMNKVKKVVSNPIIKYGLIILIISYLLYWLGFTSDLLFMTPFR